jgi:hypothetical protein
VRSNHVKKIREENYDFVFGAFSQNFESARLSIKEWRKFSFLKELSRDAWTKSIEIIKRRIF